MIKKYIKLCNKDFVSRHNRIHSVKETVQKLTDEEMNYIAEKINSMPPDKVSLARVFRTAVIKKPSLIIDVMRIFAGY